MATSPLVIVTVEVVAPGYASLVDVPMVPSDTYLNRAERRARMAVAVNALPTMDLAAIRTIAVEIDGVSVASGWVVDEGWTAIGE